MPSIVGQSLFAVALLTVALVDAAPAPTTKTIEKTKGSNVKSQVNAGKMLRRGKRQVVIEQADDDENDGENDDEILRQQLSELSDDQLLVLAQIVQSEIDKFQPDQIVDAYEIVELPDYVTAPMEMMPRDRRSASGIDMDEMRELQEALRQPMIEEEDDLGQEDSFDEPEIVVVPEEVLEAAAAEQELDDLELRERIAEIAGILNERASRRVRLL
ncbi:unnamed protein product [Caenorhabditis auriculariae]|uniref:RxLR effector protein n=1 Tax=Caenorhabditis auriculariae TaxID=2777116 RepID=A0A8S1H389_9PELO|nr:unnamed protein product [Caenorhabditis auriculariae]